MRVAIMLKAGQNEKQTVEPETCVNFPSKAGLEDAHSLRPAAVLFIILD
jgi:hypothetical protein